jgi:hypothetical protein
MKQSGLLMFTANTVSQRKCKNITSAKLRKILTNLKLSDKGVVINRTICSGQNLSMFIETGKTSLTKVWQLARNLNNQSVKRTDPLSSEALFTEVHGMLTTSHTFPSVLFAKVQLSHKILTHLLPTLKSTQNSL